MGCRCVAGGRPGRGGSYHGIVSVDGVVIILLSYMTTQ